MLSCELEAAVGFSGSWEASLVSELGGVLGGAASTSATPTPAGTVARFPPPQAQGDGAAWRQLGLPCSVLPTELARVEVQ